jgi:hypothetical protein
MNYFSMCSQSKMHNVSQRYYGLNTLINAKVAAIKRQVFYCRVQLHCLVFNHQCKVQK